MKSKSRQKDADAIQRLRAALREQATVTAATVMSAIEADTANQYSRALKALFRCRLLLQALIYQHGGEKPVGPRPPGKKGVSSRAGKVPLGKGWIHNGQGQTRKPGSRRS